MSIRSAYDPETVELFAFRIANKTASPGPSHIRNLQKTRPPGPKEVKKERSRI